MRAFQSISTTVIPLIESTSTVSSLGRVVGGQVAVQRRRAAGQQPDPAHVAVPDPCRAPVAQQDQRVLAVGHQRIVGRAEPCLQRRGAVLDPVDNLLRLLDPNTGREIGVLKDSPTYVTRLAFTLDNRRLLAASGKEMLLWDVSRRREVLRYKGCTRQVHSVAFCDGGQKVIASCGALKTPVVNGRHEYEGTGMGLAIVRKIVERHAGRITATSAPGAGAVFTILLPLKQPKEVDRP